MGELLSDGGGSSRRGYDDYRPSSGGGGGYRPPVQYEPSAPDPYKKTKIALAIVLLVFLSTLFFSCTAWLGSSLDFDDAPQITHTRSALPVPAASGSYFADEDGDWIYSPSTLNNAMRYFEEQTGVSPYLVILPNGKETSINALTELADEIYYDMYSDENHFVLVFCDDGNGSYKCGYSIGSAAATVIDQEAVDIMSRYLNRNYNDYSLDESEIFANTYVATADVIMSHPEQADAGDDDSPSPSAMPVVVLVVGGAVVLVLFMVERSAKRRKEQDEKMKEILSTPLEKFGDDDVEELAKKYEDK